MLAQSDPNAGPPSDPSSQLRQCESREECLALYAAIPDDWKAQALAFLRRLLAEQAGDLRRRHARDQEKWWAEGHFGWGMGVRNQLRSAGFGEDYFHVANLDDIYIQLIEEALGFIR